MRVEHKIPVPHLVLRLNIQLHSALEYTNNNQQPGSWIYHGK